MNKRADRRIAQLQQRLAQTRVIDRARLRRAGRLAHRVVVQIERRRGGQQRAAAVAAIRAGDAGQQRHAAQRLSAMDEARHAPAKADERLRRGAVHRGEALDVGGRNAGDLRDAIRREPRQHLMLHAIEAQRVLRDVITVAHAVAHQDVHDAQRQRRVGADADRDVPIRRLRGTGAARVDRHQLHAAFARCLDLRPEMHVGGEEVGAPADDQVGLHPRIPDRRRRSARRSRPTPPRCNCRRPCRPTAGWCPARGTRRSAGRDSSGPGARCRRSRATPADRIRR